MDAAIADRKVPQGVSQSDRRCDSCRARLGAERSMALLPEFLNGERRTLGLVRIRRPRLP